MRTRAILLTAACAAATCLPFIVSSADNPAQAKARAALRQGIAMLNAPSKPAVPDSSATVVGPREDTEGQARARQAVRKEPMLLAATAEGYSRDQAVGGLAAAPREDTEAQAKARNAVRAGSPAPIVAVAKAEPAPWKPMARKKSSNPLLEGMTPPESPFSEKQQAALAAILAPYLADQISAEEYHQKRSAIIAGS